MPVALADACRIEAILFDMNGTLRSREIHESTRHAAETRLLQLIGLHSAPEGYWDELTRRQKAYSHWADENLHQLTEAEIWTRWILPECPPLEIAPVAPELMLAWSDRKGRHVPKAGASQTIRTLKNRGYHLGVISNTMSTLDIPRSLESFGWTEHFDVIILSATFRHRKPSPEPFLEAARLLGIPPGSCAYLGNRVSKDMVGCKRAGYGLGLLLESPTGPRRDDAGQEVIPDGTIHSLEELLEIFPERG